MEDPIPSRSPRTTRRRDTAKRAHRIASRMEHREDRRKRRSPQPAGRNENDGNGNSNNNSNNSSNNSNNNSNNSNNNNNNNNNSNKDRSSNMNNSSNNNDHNSSHTAEDTSDAAPPPLRNQPHVAAPPATPGAIRVRGIDYTGNNNADEPSELLDFAAASQHNNTSAALPPPTSLPTTQETDDDDKPLDEDNDGLTQAVTLTDEELAQEYRDRVFRDVPYAECTLAQPPRPRPYRSVVLIIMLLLLLAVAGVGVGIVVVRTQTTTNTNSNDNDATNGSNSPTPSPTIERTPLPTGNEEASTMSSTAQDLYASAREKLFDPTVLDDPTSVYARVLDRIGKDPTITSSGTRLYTRYLLTVFWEMTSGPEWTRREHWNASTMSYCAWYGVTCEPELNGSGDNSQREGRVAYLDLPDNQLRGRLLPELASQPWKRLDLGDNALTGSIPSHWDRFNDGVAVDVSGNPGLSGSMPLCTTDSSSTAVARDIQVDCGSVECSCCTPSCH